MERNLKIEEYIDGNLFGQELEEFHKEIESNPELFNAVDISMEINEAIQNNGFMDMRKKLNEQGSQYASPSALLNIQKDLFRTWHIAAASFALILVVGGLLVHFVQ